MMPAVLSGMLGGLTGSIPELLRSEPKYYLLLAATLLVWSLHFALRHVINRIDEKSE